MTVAISLRYAIALLCPMIILFALAAYMYARSSHLKIAKLAIGFTLCTALAYFVDFFRLLIPVDYSHSLHLFVVLPLINTALALVLHMSYSLVSSLSKFDIKWFPQLFYMMPVIMFLYAFFETFAIGYPPYYVENGWHYRGGNGVVSLNGFLTAIMYAANLVLLIIGFDYSKTKQYRRFFASAIIVVILNLVALGIYRLEIGFLQYFIPPTPYLFLICIQVLSIALLSIRLHLLPSLVERYALLMKTSPTPIIYLDAHRRILETNDTAEHIYQLKEGKQFNDYFHFNEENRGCYDDLFKQLETEQHVKGFEVIYEDARGERPERYMLIDGSKVQIGEHMYYYFMLHDVSDEYHQAKTSEYFAYHDKLTGLHNRAYFERHVDIALKQLSPSQNGALVLADLNFFKQVNDTYGHQIGDYVLAFTAEIFEKYVSQPSLLARLGGDEFIFYMTMHSSKEDFMRRIEALRQKFQQEHFHYDDLEIEVVPSFGVAFTEDEGTNYETLYRICDARMYADKSRVKSKFPYDEFRKH